MKSSKTGQEQKPLVTAFAQFYFWKEDWALYFYPILKLSYYFLFLVS